MRPPRLGAAAAGAEDGGVGGQPAVLYARLPTLLRCRQRHAAPPTGPHRLSAARIRPPALLRSGTAVGAVKAARVYNCLFKRRLTARDALY